MNIQYLVLIILYNSIHWACSTTNFPCINNRCENATMALKAEDPPALTCKGTGTCSALRCLDVTAGKQLLKWKVRQVTTNFTHASWLYFHEQFVDFTNENDYLDCRSANLSFNINGFHDKTAFNASYNHR